MSRNDIRLVDAGPAGAVHTVKFKTDAGSTAINKGEPVALGTAPYVVAAADGAGLTSAATLVGIAATDSTHTADADGEVSVMIPHLGSRWQMAAKSAAAVDTEAEVDALIGKKVFLDLTSGAYTIDTAATEAAANGLVILGADTDAGTVDFAIRPAVTIWG